LPEAVGLARSLKMSLIVEDLMTRHPASIRPEQTLADAAQVMWDYDCGAVPVVDGSRKLLGMITDRDICMATWSRARAPSTIFVREIVSRAIISCHPEDTIARAESIMRANQIRRLPVVGPAEQLVGILSLADIARAAHHAPKVASDPDITDGLIATLAVISMAPRRSLARAQGGSVEDRAT
jgi:CBS domain-containing protein